VSGEAFDDLDAPLDLSDLRNFVAGLGAEDRVKGRFEEVADEASGVGICTKDSSSSSVLVKLVQNSVNN
jgi:hypothetical protein